jgi:hypothetical protein
MTGVTVSEEDLKRLFDLLEELKQSATNQADLLRLLVHHEYSGALSKLLPLRTQRLAYEHSDGERGSRDVAAITGKSKSTVERWWKDWTKQGLGETSTVRGGGKRFKAAYTLLELALAVLEGDVAAE